MNVHGFITPSRIIGVFLLALALATAGGAIWFYTSTTSFLRRATSVTGTVISETPSNGSNGTTYYTVYEFTDANGVKRQATSEWSSSPPAYTVGNSVQVLYTTPAGSDACIKSFASLWLGTTVCGIISFSMLLPSLVFLWFVPFIIRRVWPLPPPLPTTVTAA